MSWRKSGLLIAAALTVCAVLVVAACGKSPPADVQIKGLIERDLEANENDDVEAIYQLFAPSQREQCPYERYQDIADTGGSQSFEDNVTYSDLKMEITGETARASFIVLFDSAKVPLTDVAFVKEGSTWYFEMSADTLEACRAQPSPTPSSAE